MQQAATTLPLAQLHKLADAIAAHPRPTALARHEIVNTVPTALFRHHAAAICWAWAADGAPVAGGSAVALALLAAAGAVHDVRGEEQVSVVWTGPASYAVPVRSTAAVLAEVIGEATSTLTLVSFAAYKVASVVDALRAAADRSVDVHLVLESAAESRGALSHDARAAFEGLDDAVTFYVWPAALRLSTTGGHASMHAKCAVADRQVAFVTSANLTGAAMADNMELGLVVRGGDAPRRIADHFSGLIASGTLQVLA